MPESPAGPLVREHYLIKRMIADMASTMEDVRRGSTLDPHYVMAATDFIRTFADRCHHGKEEDILFRDLDRKPLTSEDRAEMEQLTEEHRMARSITRSLIEANARYESGDAEALSEVMECMARLAVFYPEHILKEDRHFFPAAMGYLDDDEKARMLEEFEEFEKTVLHDKYEDLVKALEERRAAVTANR